jgi:hypothetical protein
MVRVFHPFAKLVGNPMSRYEEALNLGPSEGKVCSTLGELVKFVTELVGDQSLILADPTRTPIESRTTQVVVPRFRQ